MNKWLLLLVLIGLGVAGWFHRDTISGWLVKKTEPTSTTADATPEAGPTPNPAKASQELALKTYPDLGKQGSPLNIRFVVDYNQVKTSNPTFLTQLDWPMQLANRAASELGIHPGMSSAPTPQPFVSALDGKSYGRGVTPAPTPPLLPGLTGSALDEKPKRAGRGF